jgi:hypothetical protein
MSVEVNFYEGTASIGGGAPYGESGQLVVTEAAFRSFLGGVAAGEFDRPKDTAE